MYRTHPRPGIITPFRGVQRPFWPFAVNRDSPQAEGLTHWWPMGVTQTIRNFGSLQSIPDATPGSTLIEVPTLDHGQAWSFDGSVNGTWSIPYDANTDAVLIGNSSVFIWVNYRSNASLQRLCGFIDNNLGLLYWILIDYPNTGGFALYYGSGSDVQSIQTPGLGLDDGNWHLVGGTLGGTTLTAYADGLPAGSRTIVTIAGQGLSGWFMGSSAASSPSSQRYRGLVSDARIWNRTLSVAEAAELYDPRTRWDLYYPLRQRVWSLPPSRPSSVFRKTFSGLGTGAGKRQLHRT